MNLHVSDEKSFLFELVDENGEEMGDGYGLLLYNGGTVCGDGFTDTTATAICRTMGRIGPSSWISG